MGAPIGTQGFLNDVGPKDVIVEDWRVVEQYWHFGTLKRVLINSQGYIKNEGYTPAEVDDLILRRCRAFRDGEIGGKAKRFGLTPVVSVPVHVVEQLWAEHGTDPFADEDTERELIFKNKEVMGAYGTFRRRYHRAGGAN